MDYVTAGFLHVGITDILSWIILWCVGCPVCWRLFNSVRSISSLDANSMPPQPMLLVISKNVSRHWCMSLVKTPTLRGATTTPGCKCKGWMRCFPWPSWPLTGLPRAPTAQHPQPLICSCSAAQGLQRQKCDLMGGGWDRPSSNHNLICGKQEDFISEQIVLELFRPQIFLLI